MKLYHYSKQQWPNLRTVEKQRYITAAERKQGLVEQLKYARPGAYYEHISFLLEPAPLDILGSVFGADHHAWAKGTALVEYIVDSKDIGDFAYELVETPEKTKLYYRKNLSDVDYAIEKVKFTALLDYQGAGNERFERAAKPLVGLTKVAYLKLPSFNNWVDIKNKYAPNVPHAMLYPLTGIIEYESVSRVVVK